MRRTFGWTTLGLALLAIYGWFLAATEVSLPRFLRGLPWMADFIWRMVPPDISVLSSALVGALQTLQIAVVGTSVAALLALPLGFLSARNVAPASLFYPARAILNLFRSIDTMVYAVKGVPAQPQFLACRPCVHSNHARGFVRADGRPWSGYRRHA